MGDWSSDVCSSDLHKTYITPFDRREIRELAMALDDIIDYMEAIPQSAKIYGHSNFTPQRRLFSLLYLACFSPYY